MFKCREHLVLTSWLWGTSESVSGNLYFVFWSLLDFPDSCFLLHVFQFTALNVGGASERGDKLNINLERMAFSQEAVTESSLASKILYEILLLRRGSSSSTPFWLC